MTWTAGAPAIGDRGMILAKYDAFGRRRKTTRSIRLSSGLSNQAAAPALHRIRSCCSGHTSPRKERMKRIVCIALATVIIGNAGVSAAMYEFQGVGGQELGTGLAPCAHGARPVRELPPSRTLIDSAPQHLYPNGAIGGISNSITVVRILARRCGSGIQQRPVQRNYLPSRYS